MLEYIIEYTVAIITLKKNISPVKLSIKNVNFYFTFTFFFPSTFPFFM